MGCVDLSVVRLGVAAVLRGAQRVRCNRSPEVCVVVVFVSLGWWCVV